MNSSKDEDDYTILPDGTYPIQLSPTTQEELQCVAGLEMHSLNSLKLIDLDIIKEDLRVNGNSSDFAFLSDQIKSSRISQALLVYDQSKSNGSEFLLCLTEVSKYSYQRSIEDEFLKLVKKGKNLKYKPPQPREWYDLGSGEEIEGSWVRNSRPLIRLQIKRSVKRLKFCVEFDDRNVDDSRDAYVKCESYSFGKVLKHAKIMERAVQAVPTLIESESQTELKHPKNISIQYEPRIFSQDEVAELWKSDDMKTFLQRAQDIMDEVGKMQDIMGSIRPEIEAFYKRDEIVVIEETKLVHKLFFSDLSFTRNKRISDAKWHPSIPGIVALSVIENSTYETYLDDLSQRLAMPNVVTIWSMKYSFFPQILLRIPDDITCFEWHPFEKGTLVGGCMNGQLVIWDISQYVEKLENGISTWNHEIFLESQMNKLNINDGYVPILHWSAESDKEESHLGAVESLKWLPSTVWFSHDSAYPKANQNSDEVQLITCDADGYVLIWALRKPPTDDGVDSDFEENIMPRTKSTSGGWTKLKLQSALPASLSVSGKYSPAIGKYEQLNKVWKPVHRIRFLELHAKHATDLFKVLITSLCVVDRPDLISSRKDSMAASLSEASNIKPAKKEDDKTTEQSKEEEDKEDTDEDDESPRKEIQDPSQIAYPTFLIAGTIFGSIFRVDLTKVKVDVETNDLIAKIEWVCSLHDGPVRIISRSPHNPHLIFTVGGYSWAIWNEGNLSIPVIFHYVEGGFFTDAAWSLAQEDIVFISDDEGYLQIWNITERKCQPVQTQNISGRTINAISPYYHKCDDGTMTHYISVGDETGTLYLLELPKYLRETDEERLENLLEFIESQINLKMERTLLGESTEKPDMLVNKQTDEDEFDKERHIDWDEEQYLKEYFYKEKHVLENVFGLEWKKYLKYPKLPRKKYYVELRRRDSSEERLKQKELLKLKKKKGGSIFRKY